MKRTLLTRLTLTAAAAALTLGAVACEVEDNGGVGEDPAIDDGTIDDGTIDDGTADDDL